MSAIVDTSVLLHFEKKPPASLREFLETIADPAVATITIAEILTGARAAKASSRSRAATRRFAERIESRLAVLPLDLRVAKVLGQIRGALGDALKNAGAGDLIIAATAASRSVPVYTREVNKGSFELARQVVSLDVRVVR